MATHVQAEEKKDERQQAYETMNDQLQTMGRAYKKNPYPTYEERKDVLLKMKRGLLANQQAVYDALKADYGYRSEFDTLMADLLPTVALINYCLKNLKKWMKPSKRHSGLVAMPSSVKVHYQPLGVVGVITPWNFPMYLSLGPAVQAIAAGNRVMIKMSKDTPNISATMAAALAEIKDHIHIVQGIKSAGSAFSKLPFDHLIFTGSPEVGKMVAKAAAENLTPVTLELGGKSPTIVAEDADISKAVDAIILGKSINSGQICVAPDYIFVPEAKEKEFVETYKRRYQAYHVKSKATNAHTHVVTQKQLTTMKSLLKDAEEKGAVIHPVKAYNEKDGKLLYTQVVTNVDEHMTLMQEEIFGPILPVKTYKTISEVITYINNHERPLALYLMTSNQKLINHIVKKTHSGGVSVNDTVLHVLVDDAPFGGVGNSGLGHYHGHEGFLTFSKAKTVLQSRASIPKARFALKNRDMLFKMASRFLLK